MDLHALFLYGSLFVALFFEVFLLLTYVEVRHDIKRENALLAKGPKTFPSVTVIVPCYNEEKTAAETVKSILNMEYPREKLSVILVDDGSKDKTLRALNKFKHHSQVRVISKPNGGKHTAVNLGLTLTETDLVGCLDADSYVMKDTLRNIVPYFDNQEVQVVVPSIKVFDPESFLQKLQKTEYRWGVFFRRMLSSLGAIYVTPGPFSIFRTSVFKELGEYKHAHLTEDMEMGLRLQKNKYKIVNAHSAHVYTVTPKHLPGLVTQRTRWTYGFINNVMDYKEMLFNQKYGNIGMFILPIGLFSIFYTPFMVSNLLVKIFGRLSDTVVRVQTVGFNWDWSFPSFDWYFLNTSVVPFLTIGAISMTFVIMYLAVRLADGKFRFEKEILYYIALYSFIVPLWLTKAIFNTIVRKQVVWR